jgi:tetratricopeptide (TPR) repeat protein
MKWNRRGIAALERAGRGSTLTMTAMRHNQAGLYYDAGDLRTCYEQEKALVDDIVAHQGIGGVSPYILQRLGFLQVRLEETAGGLVWLERALKQAKADGNRGLEISSMINRGFSEARLGRDAAALRDADEAERLSQDAGRMGEAGIEAIHQLRAELFMARGDATSALRELDALLARIKYPQDRSSRRLAPALTLRAKAERLLGQYAAALSSAREAVAVANERTQKADHSAQVGAALMELAQAQRASGEETAARDSARQATVALTNGLGPNHSETRMAATFR